VGDTRVEVIRRLARRGAGSALHRALEKAKAVDIASAIGHLAPAEQRLVLSHISTDELAAEVLVRVEPDELRNLARDLAFERLVKLLNAMDADDEADVIDRLPDDLRARVLGAITPEDKVLVEDILAWPEDSAGGIMQPLAFRLGEGLSCREAISALHEQEEELEHLYYIYVENENKQLVGVTSLRGLLTHSPSVLLRDIMTTDIITVVPEEDQEEVARLVSRYDLLAVPVVDNNRHLLGIVTIDDVVDVIKEEAIEDMMLMAGVSDTPPPQQSPWDAAKARVRWLIITLVTGMVISEVIHFYSSALERNIVLAGFMPVVMGMGGNVGTQAATITVRNLALGRVSVEEGVPRLLWREGRVGLLMGLFFGVLLAIYVGARHQDLNLTAGIGSSIAISLVNAAIMGTLIPLTLQRLGVDPAVATGPFVSTSIDLVTVLVYFNVTTLIFGL
jgi:magnesium transporter